MNFLIPRLVLRLLGSLSSHPLWLRSSCLTSTDGYSSPYSTSIVSVTGNSVLSFNGNVINTGSPVWSWLFLAPDKRCLSFNSLSLSGSLSGALPCVTPALPCVSPSFFSFFAASCAALFLSLKALTRGAESSSRLGCRFVQPVKRSPSKTLPCIAKSICSTCSTSMSNELAISSAHRFFVTPRLSALPCVTRAFPFVSALLDALTRRCK